MKKVVHSPPFTRSAAASIREIADTDSVGLVADGHAFVRAHNEESRPDFTGFQESEVVVNRQLELGPRLLPQAGLEVGGTNFSQPPAANGMGAGVTLEDIEQLGFAGRNGATPAASERSVGSSASRVALEARAELRAVVACRSDELELRRQENQVQALKENWLQKKELTKLQFLAAANSAEEAVNQSSGGMAIAGVSENRSTVQNRDDLQREVRDSQWMLPLHKYDSTVGGQEWRNHARCWFPQLRVRTGARAFLQSDARNCHEGPVGDRHPTNVPVASGLERGESSRLGPSIFGINAQPDVPSQNDVQDSCTGTLSGRHSVGVPVASGREGREDWRQWLLEPTVRHPRVEDMRRNDRGAQQVEATGGQLPERGRYAAASSVLGDAAVPVVRTGPGPSVMTRGELPRSATREADGLALVANALASILKQNSLPKREPARFTGRDLEDYIPFIQEFSSMIESSCDDESQLYAYLVDYTGGDAGDLVRSFSQVDKIQAYREARAALQARYGDSHLLAQHFLDKLKAWPTVKGNKPEELRILANFLNRIKNLSRQSEHFDCLSSKHELKQIVEKLPQYLNISWARKAYELQCRNGKVCFADLVAFVQQEAAIACQPYFGGPVNKGTPVSATVGTKRVLATTAEEIKPDQGRKPRNARGFKDRDGGKGFLTGANTEPLGRSRDHAESRPESRCYGCNKPGHWLRDCDDPRVRESHDRARRLDKERLCTFCEERHSLADCKNFQELNADERIKFCKSALLCFSCLRHGHFETRCRSQKGRHSLLMQGGSHGSGNTNETTESHSSYVAVAAGETRCKMSPTVVAEVRAADGTWVRTRIALDAHSTVSFMDNRLVRRLNLQGEFTQFRLTTFSESAELKKVRAMGGVELRSLDGTLYQVSSMYSVNHWPFGQKDLPPRNLVVENQVLADRIPDKGEYPIQILLGMDEPHLVRALESVDATSDGTLYAARYLLGWAVCGKIQSVRKITERCHRVSVEIEEEIRNHFSAAFNDDEPLVRGESVEDSLWRQKVKDTLRRRDDGKIEIGLPFRSNTTHLPYNYSQAAASLKTLAKKFDREPKFAADYKNFVNDLVQEGVLERVPADEVACSPGKVFFLCHHAVYHKTKSKIRIVFDCARKYKGVCLNDTLLRGPDLLNPLVGVLLRFRSEPVAVVGDVRKMFLQIKVPPDHSNYMRILWWQDSDCNSVPVQYRLTSHTFGSISSPAIANYTVKWAADQQEAYVSQEAVAAVRNSIYVDDLISCFPSPTVAARVLGEIRGVLAHAGFNLVNIACTSREVLAEVNPEDLVEDLRSVDFNTADLPAGRVLGVFWDVQKDVFGFRVTLAQTPVVWTRRRMLSTIASLFDPLGLVLPFVVSARSLFQETCREQLDWDDDLTGDLLSAWQEWLRVLPSLAECTFPRCIGLTNRNTDRLELHVFCDGSLTAYAAVAYLRRLVDGKVEGVSLLQARSRQTPVGKGPLRTVPRIELNAARLAVELALSLRKNCSVQWTEEFFWSDSEIVLTYLSSVTGRFQRFVANRVAFIQSHTQVSSWRYVPGPNNAADVASRGTLNIGVLKSTEWCNGPHFLQLPELPAFKAPVVSGEIETCRQVHAEDITAPAYFLKRIFSNVSCWLRIKLRVAVYLRFAEWLRTGKNRADPLSADVLQRAETAIWKGVQRCSFTEQLERLNNGLPVRRGDTLEKLSPFIDSDGLLKSAGRLGRLGSEVRPPPVIILPNKSQVVAAMVRYVHGIEGHLGSLHLRATVSEKYLVLGLTTLVKSVVWRCVRCRKAQGRPLCPRMADLPLARVTPVDRPFAFVGIDLFGPFYVKERRSLLKRYGVVYSCLTSRAVHFEVVGSLTADSFICSFRRFEARRGRPNEVFCDNGTNLVGAKREMELGLAEINGPTVQCKLAEKSIKWNFRPPAASHWGGAWEREIRTARRVLWSLFQDRPCRLTDELLSTLICEVEAIMNRRPLTPVQAASPDMGPLTPAHLLLPGHGEVGVPCLAVAQDIDYPGRWRAVQRYADEFWERWRKEYLVLIQQRVKWTRDAPNLRIGDLVLLTDSGLPRFRWPVGVVSSVAPSGDGAVRQVTVRMAPPRDETGKPTGGKIVELVRPAVKLIPVLRIEDS